MKNAQTPVAAQTDTPEIGWYHFAPEDCSGEIICASRNTVADFQDQHREFHIFLRADGYELRQFIGGAPGRIEVTPGFATVALAKATASAKHYAAIHTAPRQGICPDEIQCPNCETIWAPEITESTECPQCPTDGITGVTRFATFDCDKCGALWSSGKTGSCRCPKCFPGPSRPKPRLRNS